MRRKFNLRLAVETLETRSLAAPTIITYSIPSDGIDLGFGDGPNKLNKYLNKEIGAGRWQQEIASAFKTWADACGVEFVQVTDSNAPLGAVGMQGEVRIHGTAYRDNSFVAETFSGNGAGAPANATYTNDIALNFDYDFRDSGVYGLQSVLTHEVGHVLGLDHNNDPTSIMNPYVEGLTKLNVNDLRNIRALYPDPPTHTVVTLGVSTPTLHHNHHPHHRRV